MDKEAVEQYAKNVDRRRFERKLTTLAQDLRNLADVIERYRDHDIPRVSDSVSPDGYSSPSNQSYAWLARNVQHDVGYAIVNLHLDALTSEAAEFDVRRIQRHYESLTGQGENQS